MENSRFIEIEQEQQVLWIKT